MKISEVTVFLNSFICLSQSIIYQLHTCLFSYLIHIIHITIWFDYLFFLLSVNISIYLHSTYLSHSLSIYLSISLFIYLSIYLRLKFGFGRQDGLWQGWSSGRSGENAHRSHVRSFFFKYCTLRTRINWNESLLPLIFLKEINCYCCDLFISKFVQGYTYKLQNYVSK